MRNSTREQILRTLAQMAEHCPEVRFGQLVANIAYLARGATQEAIWDVEDQQFLAAAQKHLSELEAKAGEGVP